MNALILSLALITNVPEYLQEITVSVDAKDGSGTGIIKCKGDDIYVVTVAHVLTPLIKKRKKYTEQEMSRVYHNNNLGFEDTHIVKEIYTGGILLGRMILQAKVIRYSEYEDLAILKLYNSHPLIIMSAIFADKDYRYRVGDHIWHCGCFYGRQGINSISDGVISYIGRMRGVRTRDQTTAAIHPGSSGGGVYNESGVCLGIAVSRWEDSYNYFIPMRRVLSWAKRVGVDFIFDDTLPALTEKELKKWPIKEEINESIFDLIADLLD